MDLKEKIRNLVSKSNQENTTNEREIINLGELSTEDLTKIQAQTGIDLEADYQRIMDNYAVKHTFRKHGNEKQETLRG